MKCQQALSILAFVPNALSLPQYQGTPGSSEAVEMSDSQHALHESAPYDAQADAHQYANAERHDWAEGAVTEYTIHDSCNSTETAMLRNGLREAEILAAHARDHIWRWGHSSSYVKKWFGDVGLGEPAGWFDKLVHGDKDGVVFRCDDPDNVCAAEPDWGGYWRGENGTNESNICSLSFEERWNLDKMCMYGWTVAGSSYVQFWASDLHHRLWHTEVMGEGLIDHWADGYVNSTLLAMEVPQDAVRNTHTLAMFALDVYAYDIAVPGEGCTGEPTEEEVEAAVTPTPTAAADTVASSSSAAAESCHTHADGEIHCVEESHARVMASTLFAL